MKARILLIILLFITNINVFGQSGNCGSNATWTFKNGTLTISGTGVIRPGHGDSHDSDDNYKKYWKNAVTVIINPGITSTGEFAFYKCGKVTSVFLPNTLKSIGYCTFNGTSIKSITIPNSVTTIDRSAFSDCVSLTSVTMSSSTTSIGAGAFGGCISLSSITLPNSLTAIGDNAFYKCNLTTIVIPDSVNDIGKSAFSSCEKLTSVTLPASLTNMREGLFSYCKSLGSISIPNKVEYIGEGVFEGCTSLKSVEIPNSVKTLSVDAFGHNSPCVALKELIVPDSRISFASGYGGTKFYGIPNVEVVRGHENLYPDYFFDHLPDSSPFMKYFAKKRNSFSYFAYKLLSPKIKDWQQKKPFETTDQWQKRVTEDNQRKKIEELTKIAEKYYIIIYPQLVSWQQRGEYEMTDAWRRRITIDNQNDEVAELIAQAKKEIDKGKNPSEERIYGTLGAYDSDYSSFLVEIYPGISVFAKVPPSEAEEFKTKWKKVKIKPQYGVLGDTLSITACDFILGKKTYSMISNHEVDNSSELAFNLPSVNLGLEQHLTSNEKETPLVTDHSIDNNIPTASNVSSNTFAVIIGNENYQRVAKVQYAGNDAKVFAEYCQKTLGIPSNNIRSYNDATYGTMLAALKDIQNIAKAYKGNLDVIFYYAGHGVPSETDQSAYLLPVDADGTQTEVCLSTKKLYQTLNSLNAKQVVVLMDACFSGAQRGEGMLASARGVALKVKEDVPTGNMVVFTAANGEQTAYPFKEKGHGMFTYFILKKLQDTKGNVTLGDLCDYVSEQVARQSVVVNKHSQTPTVIPATTLSGSWRTMKLQ